MSAPKLLQAGYTDLVSVVPPNAELAPTTGLKPEARGKVPGVRRRDGRWVGYPWTKADPASKRDVQVWENWGANVGIKGDRYPGLDIDVDHPTLAKVVQKVATEVLGAAPVRTSTGSRRLLAYRSDEPLGNLKARLTHKGEEHLVEILGRGKQYLVHGVHPTGSQYGWDGKALWDVQPDDLPEINAEVAEAFFSRLQEELEGRVDVELSGSGAASSAVKAPPQESLRAPNLAALRDLVARIPNRYPHREEYIEFGHAVKAAGGEEAYDVFLEWALRWEGGENEPATVRADWERMQPPYRVGWSWLLEQGEEHGGVVTAQEEFDADPDAEPEDPETNPVILPGGVIDFTDTWVAERVIHWVRRKVRYVPETGHWHVWNGHAWAQDRRNQAEYLVRRALVALSQEVRKIAGSHPNEKDKKRLYKLSHDLQGRTALTKVVPELQAHPSITHTVEDFDADDWILNTPGGIIDLRTGERQDNDPDALAAKSTAVAPRKAPAPRWEAFLKETTGGDKELERFLQKQVGYSLTGSTQEQTLCFIHGPPLTGKSVFVDTIGGIFGSYHESAPADTFAKARGDRHPTDLAKLAGSRLVTAVETHEGRSWDTQRIKSITGGDRISARFMRQDFFDYRPTFKVVIVGNHEPEIDGVDEAMMRRLHVVPFENSPDERDRLLADKLREEWPQILHWAVQGCLLWLQEGLEPPEVVRARTEAYRREEDPVGRFMDECCILEDDAEVTRRDLYQAWSQWCYSQGEDAGTLKQLKRRFAKAQIRFGFEDARLYLEDGSRPQGYRGLRLKETDEWVA